MDRMDKGNGQGRMLYRSKQLTGHLRPFPRFEQPPYDMDALPDGSGNSNQSQPKLVLLRYRRTATTRPRIATWTQRVPGRAPPRATDSPVGDLHTGLDLSGRGAPGCAIRYRLVEISPANAAPPKTGQFSLATPCPKRLAAVSTRSHCRILAKATSWRFQRVRRWSDGGQPPVLIISASRIRPPASFVICTTATRCASSFRTASPGRPESSRSVPRGRHRSKRSSHRPLPSQ